MSAVHLLKMIEGRVVACSDRSYSGGTVAIGQTRNFCEIVVPNSGKSYAVGMQVFYFGELGSKAYLSCAGKKVYPYDDITADPAGSSAGNTTFPVTGQGSEIYFPFPVLLENGASAAITCEHPATAAADAIVNNLRLIVWHTGRK